MKTANEATDALVKAVGKNLMPHLDKVGRSAVDWVTKEANRKGLSPDLLPYIWWSLKTKSGLPDLDKPDYNLLFDILHRRRLMPDHSRGFFIPEDLNDEAHVRDIALGLEKWSRKVMRPMLLRGYQQALKSQAAKVPKAMEGRVPKGKEMAFLRMVFAKMLTMNSRWFEDGELLRRVVRSLPV